MKKAEAAKYAGKRGLKMTKIEKIIHEMVFNICARSHEDARPEIAQVAARRLNTEHGINCARDDSNAGDYLAEALDMYF